MDPQDLQPRDSRTRAPIARPSPPGATPESQLRRREAELSRAQRLSRLGSYEVHLLDRGFWNHRSPEYLELHGLGPESVNEPHDAWLRRVHPDDRHRAEQSFLAALASDASEYQNEYRIIRADDGAERWIKVLVEIERDDAGAAVSLFGTHRDITERKTAEIESRESNRLVNEIMNVFPGILYVYDLKTRRNVFINKGSAEAIGYEPDEIGALSDGVLDELIHPDDADRVHAHQAALSGLADGETALIEYRIHHKAGGWRWLLSQDLIYRRDASGRAWQTLGVGTDITERKDIEEALRRSQERLQLALRGARAGSFDWRADAAGSTWSADLREIVGLSLEGAGPTPAEAMAMVAPESRLAARDAALEIVRRGGPFTHDLKLKRADGRMVWLSVTGTIDLDREGHPLRAYGIAHDITDRKLREEQITLLMREVNHRANNLLSVVQGIARQTVAARPDDFLTSFRGRIQSLAVNQRLLVESEWRGVGLRELVLGQTAPFVESPAARIRIDGPDVRLTSAAAQAIGMALHELASNAAAHGALSAPAGTVAVGWDLQPDGGPTDSAGCDDGRGAQEGPGRFSMRWIESGGPVVSAPARKGFGSAVILSMVKVSIAGDVTLDYVSTGLEWRLTCPAANVLEPEA